MSKPKKTAATAQGKKTPGTVVVEKVFALPGLGNIFIQSVLNRDEPLILGIVAFLSILIMIFNLLVDISYGFLDPRIRYE